MPVLRFIAGLLLLAAVITLVRDASAWLAGSGPFQAKSLLQHWTELSPRTLASLRANGLWGLVLGPVLNLPTAGTLAALGILIGWLGRRRRKVDIYAN